MALVFKYFDIIGLSHFKYITTALTLQIPLRCSQWKEAGVLLPSMSLSHLRSLSTYRPPQAWRPHHRRGYRAKENGSARCPPTNWADAQVHWARMSGQGVSPGGRHVWLTPRRDTWACADCQAVHWQVASAGMRRSESTKEGSSCEGMIDSSPSCYFIHTS